MKRFKLHYPKLICFVIAVILAYIIFSNPYVKDFVESLGDYGYLSIFIAGIFISFGFTTPFAIGFFLVLNPENIWFASLIGALGAVLGDLVIFNFIKMSFMDEFKRLEHTKLMKEASQLMEK